MENKYTVNYGTIPYNVTVPNPRIWRVALCEGRHQIPEASDGSIFPAEVNPLDVDGMEATADQWIAEHICGRWVQHEYAVVLTVDGILHLYVTGLSVALVAVINAASKRGIPLVLWHYDRGTGGYYSQPVPHTIAGTAEPM